MILLYRHLSTEDANTYSLVLTADGIRHRLVKEWSGWAVLVPLDEAGRAAAGIESYRAENPKRAEAHRPAPPPPLRQISWGGIWIACALLGVHLAAFSPDNSLLFSRMGASADKILAGEWYRCATALLIHSSARHLIGNLAGMLIFATAVCGITGAGVGTLIIAASGMAGNLLNAMLHQSHHLSVGASTAVFGAVGILTAHQIHQRMIRRDERLWRSLLPLGAGLALLGLLSGGPRTDIMAHLLGMVAGGGLGAGYGLWVDQPPKWPVQVACGVVTAMVFIAAWVAAGTPLVG